MPVKGLAVNICDQKLAISIGGEFWMILRPLNFQQDMQSLDRAQERREADRGDTQEQVRKCILLNPGLARYFPRGFFQEQNRGKRHMTAHPPPSSILGFQVVLLLNQHK